MRNILKKVINDLFKPKPPDLTEQYFGNITPEEQLLIDQIELANKKKKLLGDEKT